MTWTISFPTSAETFNCLGFGGLIQTLSSQPFLLGDYAQCRLTVPSEPANVLAGAMVDVGGTSHRADFQMGWDARAGAPWPSSGHANFVSQYGQTVGSPCDVILDYFNATGPSIDTQVFPLYCAWDPVSQTGQGVLVNLWNQAQANWIALTNQLQAVQSCLEPSSYALGTAFSGLTGHGTISLGGAIGALVDVTASPPGWGDSWQTPPRYLPQAGSLQVQDAHGITQPYSISYPHGLWFHRRPWATQLLYNLRPLFTATITRLNAA